MTQPNPMPTEAEQSAAWAAWRRRDGVIEKWVTGKNAQYWREWPYDSPLFHFDIIRIRPTPPEPKWRTYTADEIELGMKVQRKSNKTKHMVVSIDGEGVMVGNVWRSFENLLAFYEHLDGTPCGVREGEG